MTRYQDKQLEEAVHQSLADSSSSSGPLTTSTGASSLVATATPSAFGHGSLLQGGLDRDQIGSESWTGTTESEVATPRGEAGRSTVDQGKGVAGGDEQLSTSEAQGLAETLGLAPSDHTHGLINSDDLLESIDGRRVSSVSGKTYSRKSGRQDGSSMSRIPMAEVVVEAGVSYPPLGLSSSSEAAAASNSRKARSDLTTEEREDTPGLSSADDEAGYSTPARRPRRSAAKNKDYSAKWNADGSEIRQKTRKGQSVERGNSSRRSRAPTSSAKTAQSSGKGSRAMDAISIGSDEEAQEEETGEMAPSGEGLVAADAGEGTVADSGFDEGLPVEEAQQGARGRTRATEEEEESPLPRKRNSRAARAFSRRETTPQPDREEETNDRPAKRSRRCRKNNDDGVDDEAEEVTGRPEVGTVGEDTQVGEEEDEQAQEAFETRDDTHRAADSGQVARTAVLSEADTTVNVGRGKGRRGQEHEERIKDAGDSAASSSRASTTSSLLSANKRFWGKPLRAVLSRVTSRTSGLAKRKIVSLHANRSEPPAKRAPISIPKSKQSKGADLDSDEERARENETAEQRMRRMIREMDEEGGMDEEGRMYEDSE